LLVARNGHQRNFIAGIATGHIDRIFAPHFARSRASLIVGCIGRGAPPPLPQQVRRKRDGDGN
jgi:hypothetical protein